MLLNLLLDNLLNKVIDHDINNQNRMHYNNIKFILCKC